MTFAENLIALRTKNRVSQEKVASVIGVNVRCYQRYEYGERTPSLAALIALADFYDLSLDELVCRERHSR